MSRTKLTNEEKERLRREKLAERHQEEENRRNARRMKAYNKAQEKEFARQNKASSGIKKNCQKKLARYVEKEKHSATDLRIFLDQYLSQHSVDSLLRSCGRESGENVFLAAVFHAKPDKLKVLIEAIGLAKSCLWCKSGRTKIVNSVGGASILHLAVDIRLANTPAVRLETVKILLSLLKSDIQELSKVTMTDVDGEVCSARVMANKVESPEHREILTIFTKSEEYESQNRAVLETFNFRNVLAKAGPAEPTTRAEPKMAAEDPANPAIASKEKSAMFSHEPLPAYHEIGSPKPKPKQPNNPGANLAPAEKCLSASSSSSSSSSSSPGSSSGSGSQSSSSSNSDHKHDSARISRLTGALPASSDDKQGRRRELESEVNQKRRALQEAQERNEALKNEKARLLAEIQALVVATRARTDNGARVEQASVVQEYRRNEVPPQFGSPNNFFAPVVSMSASAESAQSRIPVDDSRVNIANTILTGVSLRGKSPEKMLDLCLLLSLIVKAYPSRTVIGEELAESGAPASTAAALPTIPSRRIFSSPNCDELD